MFINRPIAWFRRKPINKDGEIKEKDKEIEQKDKEIEWKDKEIEQKEKEIEWKDGKIVQLTNGKNKAMLISRKVIEMLKEDFVLLYDKDNFDTVTIVRNFLSESQKKYALDITKEALKMYDYPQKSAEYILKNFNRKYGGRWDCFISLRNYHGTDCAYIEGYMIGFTMGQYFVVIKKGS